MTHDDMSEISATSPFVRGKVVAVTGGAGGIGSATCRTLAALGARLVVADVDDRAATAVAADITATGGEAIAVVCDVSQEDDITAMVAAAVETFGRLDGLMNNAALISDDVRDPDPVRMAVEDWDRIMAVNLRGPMLGCKHAVPVMLRQGGGSIINVSSTAGLLAENRLTAYGASKAGLLSLSRTVATAYGKQGVRCNTLVPGSVITESVRRYMTPDQLEGLGATRVTQRLGVPEDIAHTAAFLLSDWSEYVTGQVISVDGGGGVHQPWWKPYLPSTKEREQA
jgi:NAD(P)-dependent dehydrogenase (short-subunit alcohol dehydrogenase family)